MKKWIERVVILVLVVGSVAAAYAYGIHRQNEAEQQRIEEQEQRMRKKLYYVQNVSFKIGGLEALPLQEDYKYKPYSAISPGGEKELYLDLVCYQQETGNVVTLDDVKEYLSQEYEGDGTLRLYENGQYEEIGQFIEWSYHDFLWDEGVRSEFCFDVRWAYAYEQLPDPNDRSDENLDKVFAEYENLTLAELQDFVEEHYLQG